MTVPAHCGEGTCERGVVSLRGGERGQTSKTWRAEGWVEGALERLHQGTADACTYVREGKEAWDIAAQRGRQNSPWSSHRTEGSLCLYQPGWEDLRIHWALVESS